MKYLMLVFLFPFCLSSQEKGDLDYVFRSIEEAKQRPEIVYHLVLQKKKLEEFPVEVFLFQNLVSLNLSKNKISLIPAEIGDLNKLEVLDLSKNKIYKLPPQFENLTKLKELLLSRNDIEEVPKEVGKMESLEKIDLWSNNVKEIHPDISKLKRLKVLDIRGMLFETELKKGLVESLPDTEVLISGGCDCGI